MTVEAVIEAKGIYENGVYSEEKVIQVLESIKRDIIQCYSLQDPKIYISNCEFEKPKRSGNDGILKFTLTIISCLTNINLFITGHKILSVFMTDFQTRHDYKYDKGFFHHTRGGQECYCETEGD